MYTEMPPIKRCCCAPAGCELLGWAYSKLVFNILLFGGALIWLSLIFMLILFTSHAIHFILMIAIVMIFVLLDIFFSIVLIVGVRKKRTTLICLYYRYGMVQAVLLTALFLLSVGVFWVTVGDISQDSGEEHIVIVSSAIYFLFLILHVYLMFLVRNEVMKLKANGEFHFVNHAADPTCVMQTIDFPPTVENNVGVTEKILS
ncbi:unnamed protein product, partial [Iphiclides podalirius]